MTTDPSTPDASLASSDADRTAAPLTHAQVVDFPQTLSLELGGQQLPSVRIVFETWGTLNANRDNAVLICHALSGDSHVCKHDDSDIPGWWDLMVGPGKSIDTNKYFVICSNVLGGCRGTTGPNSINPATGQPYGAQFPVITMADMVHAQRRLIDHLKINRLAAVVGGSLGGHQALTWAIQHPTRVARVALLATSPRLTAQALAFDIVGRNAILRDPHFHGGQYYNQPTRPAVGLALARMLGHITYLSQEAMTLKFDAVRDQPRDIDTDFEKEFAVGTYLAYQGDKFVERFDANSYLTLSKAMDLFDLGGTVAQLSDTFLSSPNHWLVLSFTSDWLFPAHQSVSIVNGLIAAGKRVSYCNIRSDGGHDAFLLPAELDMYGHMVASFLATGDASSASPAVNATSEINPSPADHTDAPTSIFVGNRLDRDSILSLIPRHANVLDLGCGDGELLWMLQRHNPHRRLLGIELDEQSIRSAIGRGVDVVQNDLEKPLSGIRDDQFDIVVLSQTLQAVADTEGVLREMLRVGRQAIVSFPNFAYHKLRDMLYHEGKSPKTQRTYSYEWHNTPNRRYPSILDFQEFCFAKGFAVQQQIYLDTEADQPVNTDPNRNADLAIFVLGRTSEFVI